MAGNLRWLQPWKLALAARAWLWLVVVEVGVRCVALPELVRRLSQGPRQVRHRVPPARVGRIVGKTLRVGRRRPRCLAGSLVLYRLLRSQGYQAQLVIGLEEPSAGKAAHAWVELDGVDLGPPPGRGRHRALARYG